MSPGALPPPCAVSGIKVTWASASSVLDRRQGRGFEEFQYSKLDYVGGGKMLGSRLRKRCGVSLGVLLGGAHGAVGTVGRKGLVAARDKMSRAEQTIGGCTDYRHDRCAHQDPRANPRRSHTTSESFVLARMD